METKISAKHSKQVNVYVNIESFRSISFAWTLSHRRNFLGRLRSIDNQPCVDRKWNRRNLVFENIHTERSKRKKNTNLLEKILWKVTNIGLGYTKDVCTLYCRLLLKKHTWTENERNNEKICGTMTRTAFKRASALWVRRGTEYACWQWIHSIRRMVLKRTETKQHSLCHIVVETPPTDSIYCAVIRLQRIFSLHVYWCWLFHSKNIKTIMFLRRTQQVTFRLLACCW